MSTNNRRVAAYIPLELGQRLTAWMKQKGIKSESQAVIHALEAVLGKDKKPPAIDRLQKLEARVKAIEKRLGGDFNG